MDRTELLRAIRERTPDDRYGIGIASNYLKALSGCFDGGFCPRAMNGVSAEEWAGVLKDAEQKFVYSQAGMNIKGVLEPSETDYLLEFECVITSNKKDRDGDVLETAGAILDPMAPLLWQHDPFHPIGKVLRRTGQSSSKLTGRCCVLDFGGGDGELASMARDAAVLVRANALRISHGFDPREFSALDEKDGRYLISKLEILEVSLVSIPSNTDAIITAFSNKKLHSAMIKGYAEGLFRARPVQGIGFDSPSMIVQQQGEFSRGVFPALKFTGLDGKVTEAAVSKHPAECSCHKKDAAAHPIRHEGESVNDCVSRKIEILENEGGRSHEQNIAIAESMCREGKSKEQAVSDFEKLAAIFAKPQTEKIMTKESQPVVPVTPVATKGQETMTGPANTSVPGTARMDNEVVIPQGPQQGDQQWPERHMATRVSDHPLVGVDDFDVSNTADDAIMAIAAGGMTGAQQNPAPDTALATNAGPRAEPGVPTPTMGVQKPISMPTVYDVSTSPGPQSSRAEPSLSNSVQGPKDAAVPTIKETSVNDDRQVQPLDSDDASHHDTQGNIEHEVIVDAPHLKQVAGMIQHSGKEGAMYMHPGKGHVHHVAHPDDLHPDNAHMYHGHDEIKSLYGSVRGVKGVKVAIQQHPTKGMGYKMMYCGSRVPGSDPGMGDGTERVSMNPSLKALLVAKLAMEHIFHSMAKDDTKRAALALNYKLLMEIIQKFSSIDPAMNGMSATLPANNVLDQHSLGNFTNIPGNNNLNGSSITGFQGSAQPSQGTPTNNSLNTDSVTGFGQAMQPNTPAANPPTSGKQGAVVVQLPRDVSISHERVGADGVPNVQPHHTNIVVDGKEWPRHIDPDMGGGVDQVNLEESLSFGYDVLGVSSGVLNENDVMSWLDSAGNPKAGEPDAHAEFDEMFTKELAVDFEASQFDEMFSE